MGPPFPQNQIALLKCLWDTSVKSAVRSPGVRRGITVRECVAGQFFWLALESSAAPQKAEPQTQIARYAEVARECALR